LPAWEREVYAAIVDAAGAAARGATADVLVERCGCSSVSTTVNLVQRLEQKGLIRVERYQRTRRMTIVSTGKSTAPVGNRTPHWRTAPRPRSVPTVALSYVLDRKPDLARDIMKAARAEGIDVQAFIAELVWAGWQERAAVLEGA